MFEAIDLDERLLDQAAQQREVRRVSEQNADSQNDEATFEEAKRAAAAAYSDRALGALARWALRGAK